MSRPRCGRRVIRDLHDKGLAKPGQAHPERRASMGDGVGRKLTDNQLDIVNDGLQPMLVKVLTNEPARSNNAEGLSLQLDLMRPKRTTSHRQPAGQARTLRPTSVRGLGTNGRIP